MILLLNENFNIKKDDEDDEIILEDFDLEGFAFTPVYLPYSHWRVKELFREKYGIEVAAIYGGYKANRYRDCLTYRLTWLDTGEEIVSGINLYQMRCFLAKQRFPLREPENPRNQGCVRFLEALENLKESETDENS